MRHLRKHYQIDLKIMLEQVRKVLNDIKGAIVERGVDVGDCDSPTTYPSRILSIPDDSPVSVTFIPVFKASDTKPAKPSTTPSLDVVVTGIYPTGWSTPDGLEGTLWMSYAIVGNNTVYQNWTEPIPINAPDTSHTKTFQNYLELESLDLNPSTPTGGTYDVEHDTITGDVVSTLANQEQVTWSNENLHRPGGYTYLSMATFSSTDGNIIGSWSEPVCINSAKDGKDGIDGIDGIDGTDGSNGALGKTAYPAGEWDNSKIYTADETSVPYVTYNDGYWLLIANSSVNNQPSSESTYWERMTQFDSVVTKLLIADGGTLGKFVFSGDYMFSEDGVYNDETKSYTWAIENSHFNISSTGEFTDWVPKFCVNQKTGALFASDVNLTGAINATSGKFTGEGSFCNELVEFNSDGTGHIGDNGLTWDEDGNITINRGVITGTTVWTPKYNADLAIDQKTLNIYDANNNLFVYKNVQYGSNGILIINPEFTQNTIKEWTIYSSATEILLEILSEVPFRLITIIDGITSIDPKSANITYSPLIAGTDGFYKYKISIIGSTDNSQNSPRSLLIEEIAGPQAEDPQ